MATTNRVNTSINMGEDVLDALRISAAEERSNVSAKVEQICRAHFERVGWPEVSRKSDTKRKTRKPAAAKR